MLKYTEETIIICHNLSFSNIEVTTINLSKTDMKNSNDNRLLFDIIPLYDYHLMDY